MRSKAPFLGQTNKTEIRIRNFRFRTIWKIKKFQYSKTSNAVISLGPPRSLRWNGEAPQTAHRPIDSPYSEGFIGKVPFSRYENRAHDRWPFFFGARQTKCITNLTNRRRRRYIVENDDRLLLPIIDRASWSLINDVTEQTSAEAHSESSELSLGERRPIGSERE